MILVAGPYRSGTGDDPAKLAANVRAMQETSLVLFRAGHLPVTGEAVALPLLEVAGSTGPGDPQFEETSDGTSDGTFEERFEERFEEIFHPAAERLLARCDAVLRIGGPSAGADRMAELARAQGKHVYTDLADIPAPEGNPV
ncbi:DUF4406 domain-containing protein [Streptomyces sp. NPDC002920]